MKTPLNLEFYVRDAYKAVQRGDLVIVIDVLRCCSTIITALANGVKEIIPVITLKEARLFHRKHPEFILAGERRAVKPRGFALGNSPREFTPQKVSGRPVVLTTTSGTKAIVVSKKARWVLVGALLNAEAIAAAVSRIATKENVGVSFVLSGRSGRFFIEDFVCAGAIAESLRIENTEISDAVTAALLCFQQAESNLERVIQSGHHARYLNSLGLGDDVEFCCRLNAFKIVPFLKGDVIIPMARV